MRFQLVSDTHLSDFTLNTEADLIVHLGDISNGNGKYILDFVNKCNEINKPYVLVLGNHDYYGASIQSSIDFLNANNINYLTDRMEYKFQDFTFVGGTFFTDFTLNAKTDQDVDNNKMYAGSGIYDFYYIRNNNKLITPNDYVTLHNQQWNWIQQYRHRPNVVVLTHFPPNPVALTDYWRINGGTLNPYFINTKDLTGFKLWCCGHVHTAFDTEVNGCRVVCNPLGYPSETDTTLYTNNKLITIEKE
jgi:predicted phosphodiesterase